MNIKERRELLRSLDIRILTLMQARYDLAAELDSDIEQELGIDPMSSCDVEISVLRNHMKALHMESGLIEKFPEFMVRHVR